MPAHRDRHLSGTADQHGTLVDVGFVDDRDVDIAEVAACRGPLVARRSHGIEDVGFLQKYGVLRSVVEIGKLLAPTPTNFVLPLKNFRLR